MTYNSFREALTETEKEITEKINSDRKFHIMGIKARYIYAKKLKKKLHLKQLQRIIIDAEQKMTIINKI